MKINRLLPTEELIYRLHYISDTHIRQKRRVQNKDSNASETLSRDVIRKEIQLALGSLACKFIVRKKQGENEEGLVSQASMACQGPRDHRGLKGLKEIRGLPDPKAISVLKDPRAILVNPSQLLLLCHPRFPWW